MIQKLHLFLGMEPMLPVRHDGQISMVLRCKRRYCFDRCQVVVLAVQDAGGDIPDDRVLTHIAKIRP